MKHIPASAALALLATASASTAGVLYMKYDELLKTEPVFQADSALSEAKLTDCVYLPYRTETAYKFNDLSSGGHEIVVAGGSSNSAIAIVQISSLPDGRSHIAVYKHHIMKDPYKFVARAKACLAPT